MTVTTLFVGGPLDGEVREIPDNEPVIKGAVITRPDWTVAVADEPIGRIVNYIERRLNFFGTVLGVHVAEGTPQERFEATLYTHLLSDLGKQLVVR